MLLYRAWADAQTKTNFSIRLSASDPKKNICLSMREAEPSEYGNGSSSLRTQSPCLPEARAYTFFRIRWRETTSSCNLAPQREGHLGWLNHSLTQTNRMAIRFSAYYWVASG